MTEKKQKISDTKYTYLDLEVYPEETFDYIKVDEFGDEQIKAEFNAWLNGQTCPLIIEDGKPMNVAYLWDFERWYEQKHYNRGTYFD